jgi:PAS domain S-box-containing protein
MDANVPDAQCSTYLTPKGEIDAQLFQSSFDCIKIIDLDGRLVQMNPGATDALELDDWEALYGQEWTSLWPDDAKDAVNMAMATARACKRAQFSAYSPTLKGSDRWWDVVVSPLLDEDGRVDRLMAVSRDVSEVHLAREALREADRRKDDFLAVLAHELRNPLSTAGRRIALSMGPRFRGESFLPVAGTTS